MKYWPFLPFHYGKRGLFILIIISTIYGCSSTEKFESAPVMPNEGGKYASASYYEKLNEREHFINPEIISSNLKLKPYDNYFESNAFNSDKLGNKEDISSPSLKIAKSNYLKNDKFKRKIRNLNTKEVNNRVNPIYDSSSKTSGKINLDSQYTKKSSVEKDEEKDLAVNSIEVIDKNTTNDRGESYNPDVEKDNIKNEEDENKTKLPFNEEKENANDHKTDRKNGDGDEYDYEENEIIKDNKGKVNCHSHEKIHKENSGQEVTASLQQYNFKIVGPKESNKVENVCSSEGKNESDTCKKNANDKQRECENKDLVIIQPIRQIKHKSDAKYNIVSKDNLGVNGAINNIFNRLSDTLNSIENGDKNCDKKDIFLKSNDEIINHNKQCFGLSSHHLDRFDNLLKNWHVQGLHDRHREVDQRSGIPKMGNNYFNHLDYSKLEREKHLISDSLCRGKKHYDTNHEDTKQNHIGKTYQEKHSSFANNHEHEDDSDNLLQKQASLSGRKNYKNGPPEINFNSLSDSQYNDVLDPQISKTLITNNERLQNNHKTFDSIEEANDGKMLFLQQKLNPIFNENGNKDLPNGLIYPEVNPQVKFPRHYVRSANDCSSESAVALNYVKNHEIYPDLYVYTNSQYRNEKSLPSVYSAGDEKFLEIQPLLNVSKFEVSKLRRSKRKNSDMYNNVESRNKQTVGIKKRSIMQKESVALRPFHRNDFSEESNDYAEEMANFSNSNVKSSDTVYDYDFSENDENSRENNFDDINGGGQRNIISNDLSKISEPVYDVEKTRKTGKSLKHKYTKKKSKKILFDKSDEDKLNDDKLNEDNMNENKQIMTSHVKKHKNKGKKIEQIQEDSYRDMLVTTSRSGSRSAAPKNLSESGMANFGGHIFGRQVGKQCHPPAGPPKFRWCSETSDPVKDQEYEDALKGKVALRIVEVILAKVQKSSKMTTDFGFCRNQKSPSTIDEENECIAQNSLLKSEDLKDIMSSLDKMSYKGCNQLPPKLREFLEWLVRVKKVRSVHPKNLKSGKHSHSNCSLGDSAFLFHRYNTHSSSSYQEPQLRRTGYNPRVPYEAVVDYDYDHHSNKKVSINKRKVVNSVSAMQNLAEDYSSLLGKDPILEAIPDENSAKNENSLVSKHLDPLLTEKRRSVANVNEINFVDNIINSDDGDSRDEISNFNQADNILSVFNDNENAFNYNLRNNVASIRDLTKYDTDFDDSADKKYKKGKEISSDLNQRINKRKFISKELNSYIKNNYEKMRRKQISRKDKVGVHEFFGEKYENLNSDYDKNEQNKLRGSIKCFEDNNDMQKSKREIKDGNEKQMGFYTPVVFHISDEYEI